MRVAILTVWVLFSFFVNAQKKNQQGSVPEVGKRMPDFVFNDITHFKYKTATLKEFKGKWLFLDFWSPGCVACVQSFPHVNSLQKEFSRDAQFVLVGLNSWTYRKVIKPLYERLREKNNFQLATAYDSLLFSKWEVHKMPHIFVIDPKGVLRFITDGRDMTSAKVRALVYGENVSFYSKVETEKLFNDSPRGYVSDSVVYKSVLTKWNGEQQRAYSRIEDSPGSATKTKFEASMVPLEWLYKYAFMGQQEWPNRRDSLYYMAYPFLALDLEDPTPFQFDYRENVGKNMYNYQLVLPGSNRGRDVMMETMQIELKNIFGYKASLQRRKQPVWKLTCAPGAAVKLHTKGGAPYYSGEDGSGSAAGFVARNFRMINLANLIMRYIGYTEPPLFDETGITGNIDIVIDADMTRKDDIIRELRKHGLDMVKGEREMLTIVIEDGM